MDPELIRLDRTVSTLATTFVRILIRRLRFSWYQASGSRRAIATKRGRGTTNPPWKMRSWNCELLINPPEKEEAMVIYMHNCKSRSEKKGIGIPEVYAILTGTRGEDENCPITVQEFIYEQGKDLYCRQVSSTVGYPGSKYSYDRYGLLTCTVPIDVVTQKVVPASLQARLLHHAHYPTLACHPDERHI